MRLKTPGLVDAHPWYRHLTRAFVWILKDLGALHSAELPYRFHNPYVAIRIEPEKETQSAQMEGHWTRFAAKGDRNLEAPSGPDAPVSWPNTAQSDTHLELDLTIKAGTGLRNDDSDFRDWITP